MTTLTIGDAASAYAASLCLLARWRQPRTWLTDQHPSRCGWCDVPRDVLDGMVRRYDELEAFDARNGTDVAGAEHFRALPTARKAAAIAVAQELVSEPPPAPGLVMAIQTSEPAPAETDAPPPPAWLGGPS